MVVGHVDVIEAYRQHPPPVALFLGPESVGKATAARELFAEQGIGGTRLLSVERLTTEAARDVVAFIRSVGSRGVLLDLDGASIEGLNALLKTLESTPPDARFILTASSPPIATITSRAVTYRFGYLSDEEVAQVLTRLRGLGEQRARDAARRSGGQVQPALQALAAGDSRGPVLNVLRAVAMGDEGLFTATVGGKRLVQVNGHEERRDAVDAQQLGLLRTWALEARTRRWRLFSPDESYGLDRDPEVIDRVLLVTRNPSRPRVAFRAALLPLVWSRGTS